MKCSFLIILTFINIYLSQAQKKHDVIHKLDRTAFSANIYQTGSFEITYFLPSDKAKLKKYSIKHSEIWKVNYANGKIKIFNNINKPIVKYSPNNSIDLIILKDKTTINCKIISLNKTYIKYRLVGANDIITHVISRSKVERVEYNIAKVSSSTNIKIDSLDSGLTKKINSESLDKEITNTQISNKYSAGTDKINEDSASPKVVSNNNKPKRFSTTIGFDISRALGGNEWVDKKNGMGLKFGIGGSIALNYLLNKRFSLVANLGAIGWQVEKIFKDSLSNIVKPSQYNSIILIPLHVGIKLYLSKKIYISPQSTLTFYSEKDIEKSMVDYSSNTYFQYSGLKVGYRLELGYECRFGKKMVQLNSYYSTVLINDLGYIKNFQDFSYGGIKCAFGLGI